VRNREEVVFYFLPRILENEKRESRRKKVKDTPLVEQAGFQSSSKLSTTDGR